MRQAVLKLQLAQRKRLASVKGKLPRQHMEQHQRKAVNIGPMVDFFGGHLLWGHIEQCPCAGVLGSSICTERGCQPEICQVGDSAAV